MGLVSKSLENDANGRSVSGASGTRSDTNTLEKTDTILTIGRLKLRGQTDDLPQDWWFASTAIPLLAATIGPLANVLSIAALVSKWRVKLPNGGVLPEGSDVYGIDIPDPQWEIILNAISLACGFFGNFCLLLNFTRRVRYIVALPATIIAWYFATGILIAITVAMNEHVPPVRPEETYSQGFWHAIIAAVLYLIGSMLLMVNMLGYFLGHYPQHFDLDDDQRTLILQTMMFFFWLAGGAAVFQKLCGFSYADALYFCDVTVLTIGFGDLVGNNDAGRGLVFPYSIFGIIFLGLMINSIRKFASSMSKDKIIRKHQLNERERTFGRSVTSEKELRDRLGLPPKREDDPRRQSTVRKPSAAGTLPHRTSLDQYGRFDVHGRTITFYETKKHGKGGGGRGGAGRTFKHKPPLSRDAKMQERASGKSDHVRRAKRREKLILLKEEKDRFDAMREIQAHTSRFKQYSALGMSILAFGILWCVGALVFMIAEKRIQDLTYFQSLYFCYVSLLTIGYGDFSPKSNAGKPFFIVWSLVAIPTMTILISEMGDTVISAINRGTFTLADWTVMPKEGVWAEFLDKHPKLKNWIEQKTKERAEKRRLARGFTIQDPDEEAGIDDDTKGPTLEKLAEEPAELTEHELARKLAIAIKRMAIDLRADKPKKYSYEEWVDFTRLIRFSGNKQLKDVEIDEEEGLIEWDWIGEDSPMLADVGESEWIMDRLIESLNRYTKRQARESKARAKAPAIHIAEDIHPHPHPHLYPSHPGPRSPTSRRSVELHSPVLSRNSSGDAMVKIYKREKEKTPEKAQADIGDDSDVEGLDMRRKGLRGDSGESGESSTSGSTVKSDEIEVLDDPRVRDWASR